jgi:hypothetical protein
MNCETSKPYRIIVGHDALRIFKQVRILDSYIFINACARLCLFAVTDETDLKENTK